MSSPGPADLPPQVAAALGRRRADAFRALRLLQYAAVCPSVIRDVDAVVHAARVLRGRAPVGRAAALYLVPAQRHA